MTKKKNITNGYFAEFPTRLRYLMKSHGVKQLELSAALGLKTRQSITGYIDGSILPPLDKLIAIADFFNVSVDWLLCRPGATQTTDADTRSVCEFLALSETAINNIKTIAADRKPVGAAITTKAALSLFLENVELVELCDNLAMLYGKGALPNLSDEELTELHDIEARLTEKYGVTISVKPNEYGEFKRTAQHYFTEIMSDIIHARVWSEKTVGGCFIG